MTLKFHVCWLTFTTPTLWLYSYPRRHTTSLSVCPVQKGGGGGRGKLFTSYADLMTGLMIVITYCGSLSIVFTAGGGSLWTLQYHKNLYITSCGCKLRTYKKSGRKILRILTKKSQKYTMLSAKKIKCYTFWDQNHTGFTVKKSNIWSML